jgi:hypothetical protein
VTEGTVVNMATESSTSVPSPIEDVQGDKMELLAGPKRRLWNHRNRIYPF